MSREPGITLAVSAADCMPILYAAPGTVGAAHSGWRGTADGMPRAALLALCELAGVPPEAVTVFLGPCIRSCCYEVGPEVAARFPAACSRRVEGSLRLDVPAAVTSQLLEAGIRPERLHDSGACTACEPAWYFSHRRDRGLTGRQWGLIALTGGR